MSSVQRCLVLGLVLAAVCVAAFAQQPPPNAAAPKPARPRMGIEVPKLGDGPFVYDTAEHQKIKVTIAARGLVHPWSMLWLPDGGMLITELRGKLKLFRDGAMKEIPGTPEVRAQGLMGLMDIALHPNYAQNHLVYFSYDKLTGNPAVPNEAQLAVGRARFDGNSLVDRQELLTTDAYRVVGGTASRIAFDRAGLLYVTSGASNTNQAQEGDSLLGKVLRLRDDGTPAPGNPFAGKPGFRPEVYTMGHRNQLGLTFHPVTGVLLSAEHGPDGGDEVNVIQAGRNYGWPLVSFGRTYEGPRVSENPWREGIELPLLYWVPSIAISGIAVYTGDKFPAWKNNLFVGSMRVGEVPGTAHLERIVLNDKMEELRREMLLTDLRQRIRDVRQGPDGNLYLLTDEENGVLFRIEPTN
jgi:aldose sugar dehydrogenase